VTSIPHRIEFSEYKEISDLTTGEEALTEMMDRVLKEGLEGLMIKDIGDVYKPDKRHWLKLKKGVCRVSCVVCVACVACVACV
jgi:DNA ligase-3